LSREPTGVGNASFEGFDNGRHSASATSESSLFRGVLDGCASLTE
jgi:hypothetical protein